MRKLFSKVMTWISRLETQTARRSVAADLKKASAAMFGLLLVSVPGAYASVFKALAELVDVKVAGLQVSTWTLVALGTGVVVLRVLAFLLECDLKPADKPDKVSSRTSSKRR